MLPNPRLKDKYGLAAEQLKQSLDTVTTNSPINRREGNLEQAALEEKSAESFRAAIKALLKGTKTKS
jgi:hypothetical protein